MKLCWDMIWGVSKLIEFINLKKYRKRKTWIIEGWLLTQTPTPFIFPPLSIAQPLLFPRPKAPTLPERERDVGDLMTTRPPTPKSKPQPCITQIAPKTNPKTLLLAREDRDLENAGRGGHQKCLCVASTPIRTRRRQAEAKRRRRRRIGAMAGQRTKKSQTLTRPRPFCLIKH